MILALRLNLMEKDRFRGVFYVILFYLGITIPFLNLHKITLFRLFYFLLWFVMVFFQYFKRKKDILSSCDKISRLLFRLCIFFLSFFILTTLYLLLSYCAFHVNFTVNKTQIINLEDMNFDEDVYHGYVEDQLTGFQFRLFPNADRLRETADKYIFVRLTGMLSNEHSYPISSLRNCWRGSRSIDPMRDTYFKVKSVGNLTLKAGESIEYECDLIVPAKYRASFLSPIDVLNEQTNGSAPLPETLSSSISENIYVFGLSCF